MRVSCRSPNCSIVFCLHRFLPVLHSLKAMDSNASSESNADDPDYADDEQPVITLGEPYRTPNIRRLKSSIQQKAKDSAKSHDPNEGRCLLTNTDVKSAIDVAHIVARSTDEKEVHAMAIDHLLPSDFG